MTQALSPPKTESTVWVLMKQQADLRPARTIKDWKARGQFVYDALQKTAQTSQATTITTLSTKGAKYKSYWVINAIRVTTDANTLATVAKDPGVSKIVSEEQVRLVRPTPNKPTPRTTSIEWGLSNIGAPDVWSGFGVRGENIVVGNIDTGVQFDHPALAAHYRGGSGGSVDHSYNFYDPENACAGTPCDTDGHGTHTTGTVVGDDGAGNQIGVAPGAKFIYAVGIPGGSGSFETLLDVGQWMLAPRDAAGNNPRPDLRPHIVTNSWGTTASNTTLQPMVQAWVAAGMFPAFANGNNGPGCGTAGSPGDYPEAYGVGAHDINNAIASFSSRGPSVLGAGKPDISAPGVNVRSSVPGNAYGSLSGTSMATPHLAGAVALLWSAAPALIGDIQATRALLGQTAIDTDDTSCGGTAANNNVYGEGRLDILAAVTQSPHGPTGTLAGTVTAATGGAAIAGANVVVGNRATTTSATGAYALTLPVGSADVTVSAFGYTTQTRPVTISDGATTTLNVALAAAAAHSLSGTVRDAAGAALAGASVSVQNTPLPPATTDAAGHYSFAAVPDGVYQVAASAGRCNSGQTASVTLSANTTQDFTLPRRSDSYGYYCQIVAPAYINGVTDVVTGDDQAAPVTLPFAFSLYGQSYTTAFVSTNGFLNFLASATAYSNGAIPSLAAPNAALYPFWDDLNADAAAHVRTATVGSAPNRQFVIEWNNVTFYGSTARLSFEVVLHENGQILMQYKDIGSEGNEGGNSATIGIENAAGDTAFQYATNEVAITDNLAVLYRLPPAGIITGTVTDQNDHAPIGGATIRVLSGGTQVRAGRTDSQGVYRLQVPVGSFTVEASVNGYGAATAAVTVVADAVVTQDFALRTARAEIAPGFLEIVVPRDQIRTRSLLLRNSGSTDLHWQIGESGGQAHAVVSTFKLAKKVSFDPLSRTTQATYKGGVTARGWTAATPGSILRQFTTAIQPWGVGVHGTLWLSDPDTKKNHEFTPQGAATSRVWDATWATTWPADSAWDSAHGAMCQVNVGGDNGIHCWDPATGAEVGSITGAQPWTAVSQRGLAYRADDDTFYIGGWNEGVIYHVKGLSHADKGAVIEQCSPSDGGISGLAYNEAAGILWAATNSATDTIYQLSPDTCQVLGTLPHPAPGNNGAGLEMDETGNLWMIGQGSKTVYLIESGVPAFNDVPWLSVTPSQGTLAPGGSSNLGVTINASGLAPGVYLATIYISSNSGRQALLPVPVSLVVSSYRTGVNAGGKAYNDVLQDRWTADRKYTAGSYGYIQNGTLKSTSRNIAGADEQTLFQDQRRDFYAYRFDGVPNGVYEVELLFAELQNQQPNRRLFDIILENNLMLPAYDIAYEVGSFAADYRKFLVEVTDGRLDARFVARKGVPVVNGIRVTQRPDH